MWKPAFYLEVKAEASLLSGGKGGSQRFIWRRLQKPIFFREVEASLYLEKPAFYLEAKAEASLLPRGKGGSQPFT
jgi:hypothetical protein